MKAGWATGMYYMSKWSLFIFPPEQVKMVSSDAHADSKAKNQKIKFWKTDCMFKSLAQENG